MNLGHLQNLMGPHGLFEHALYREPRPEHGYCTDDNARAVVVTASETSPEGGRIFAACLRFVAAGFLPEGWRNRMSVDGVWLDGPGPEDAHGRALWALGTAAAVGRLPDRLAEVTEVALAHPLRSLRSNLYSILGSCSLLPTALRQEAEDALARAVGRLPGLGDRRWPWPEPRLTYDNARLPEAMIRAGEAIGDRRLRDGGLDLLDWLVEVESRESWFSFTPVGGRGPGEEGPAFDQQPIEAWAMADACESALSVTGDQRWRERARRAVAWFEGLNDVGVPVHDPATGAGFDGLERSGVNQNCGAESTLSALGARLVSQRLGLEWPTVPM